MNRREYQSLGNIIADIKQQLGILTSIEISYKGRTKGDVYFRRVQLIKTKLQGLKNKLSDFGKQTFYKYTGTLENGSTFEIIYDSRVTEDDVLLHIEFLTGTKVKLYRVDSTIKTGEIIITRKT